MPQCRCGRTIRSGRKCKQCALDDYWEERAKRDLDDEDDDLATDGGRDFGGCYCWAGPGDGPRRPPDAFESREETDG